jgi:CheY-like chemotaxis protein
MSIALLCSPSPLEAELKETAVWREDVSRHLARTADEALEKAREVRPDIVVVDRDMTGADRIVSTLRKNAPTRQSSIVIIARGELDPIEVELLEAGANAVFRLPVGPDWDGRMERLLTVPVRREARLPVRFEMEARSGAGVESYSATVLNLSISGMLIDTPLTLQIGDDLDISFQLPDSDTVIRGTGRVVRKAGRTHFGIEFYGLEGDGQAEIEAYVKSSEPRE